MRRTKHALRLIGILIWKWYSWWFNNRTLPRYLLHEKRDYPLDFAVAVDDPKIQARVKQWSRHEHHEYFYDLQQTCVIEPTQGYILTPHLALVERSFAYHHLNSSRPFRAALAILAYTFQRKPIPTIDVALSLRDLNEGNYWHFMDDILSKLEILEMYEFRRDIPILVGTRLWNSPFFQQAIAHEPLKSYHWYLHDHLVCVKRIIFGARMSLQATNMHFVLRILNVQSHAQPTKRIFINRAIQRGRYLVNNEDVVQLMLQFGFEIVECETLTLNQQKELFSQARYVVGIHGAGLINIVYAYPHRIDVLELFPDTYIHPHYIWLARAFGYRYDGLVGVAQPNTQAFTLDIAALECKLKHMLSTI